MKYLKNLKKNTLWESINFTIKIVYVVQHYHTPYQQEKDTFVITANLLLLYHRLEKGLLQSTSVTHFIVIYEAKWDRKPIEDMIPCFYSTSSHYSYESVSKKLHKVTASDF